MIEQWFEDATKRNWGLPWHLFLACYLTTNTYLAIVKYELLPYNVAIGVAFFAWQVIGYVYELIQARKEHPVTPEEHQNFAQDRREDLLFNSIGGVLGILPALLIW